jgi:hypothetical protein
MKPTFVQTCRISLLTAFLAATMPQTGLAGISATSPWENGAYYTFLVSSSPLASSRHE